MREIQEHYPEIWIKEQNHDSDHVHLMLTSRRPSVLGRQGILSTPWLTERHGYDPTLEKLALGVHGRGRDFAPLSKSRGNAPVSLAFVP